MDGSWWRVLTERGPLEKGRTCLENPMSNTKRRKDRTLEDELPRLEGAQYATGEEQRNSSRKSEEAKPERKPHPAVGVIGDGCKV